MGFSIRFQGAEELKSKFKAMESSARSEVLAKSVPPAADYVRESIFARAPVKSGLLASHITTALKSQTDTRYVQGIYIAPEAFYWRFLEFGTTRMPAHPFIREAFYGSRRNARNEIRDGIRDAVLGFTV
jgi:HK97 gp10 family phage protein